MYENRLILGAAQKREDICHESKDRTSLVKLHKTVDSLNYAVAVVGTMTAKLQLDKEKQSLPLQSQVCNGT